MPLSNAELETIINWNHEDDTANVFSYEKRVQRHMEKLGIKPTYENSFGGKSYDIPKKWCKLPRKTRTRVMTDEQLQSMKDRFAISRKNRSKK